MTAANNTARAAGLFFGNQTQGGNCAGSTETFSFLVDYAINKHFDVYSGVSVQDISGGLASGYLANNNTTVVTGMRLRF